MNGVLDSAFRRHYDRVYRYVRRRTGDAFRAEDITQAVFADASRALPATTDDSQVLPWLYAVAKRRFTDEARRRAREPVAVADVAAVVVDDYGPIVAGAIGRALGRLPGDQRTVLVLKLIRGASFRELARELRTSEAAAKMRFARSLRALRAELEREGITP